MSSPAGRTIRFRRERPRDGTWDFAKSRFDSHRGSSMGEGTFNTPPQKIDPADILALPILQEVGGDQAAWPPRLHLGLRSRAQGRKPRALPGLGQKSTRWRTGPSPTFWTGSGRTSSRVPATTSGPGSMPLGMTRRSPGRIMPVRGTISIFATGQRWSSTLTCKRGPSIRTSCTTTPR